jgi:sulfur-carrier protein adenylyltransferase/sulfurtransferase
MSTTYRDLLERTKAQITEVDVPQAAQLLAQGARAIDVREPDEVEQGLIPGAVAIPRGFLEARIEETVRDRDTPVVLYCAGGARSAFAAQSLQELGYTHVVSLAGGFGAWKGGGQPWTVPTAFTAEQRRRYSRHFLLPEVGEDGAAHPPRGQSAVDWRRGPGESGGALSGGGGGGHAGDRR